MKKLSKKATPMLLIRDDHILLAMKKRGFGAGKWNGVGGKPEGDETIDQTALRECSEEIDVSPIDIKHVATLDFYFASGKSDWDQQVSVYLCKKWQGEPTETEEMKPKWFNVADIPYESMWQDDKYWLPEVFAGKTVEAQFTFDDNDNLLRHNLTTI